VLTEEEEIREMAKLVVITDMQGKLLGAVRSEPYRTSNGKVIRFVPHPRHKHYPLEVDERVLQLSANELGKFLRARLNEPKPIAETTSKIN
jgi:hypothetical protein